MDNMFNKNQKIGEIAAKFHRAMETFKKHKIDFCCGGDTQLAEAVKEKNLNVDEIISEINEDYNKYVTEEVKDKNWTSESYSKLIEHVVNTHHAYLNETLPRLSELTTKILRVYGANHSELSKVIEEANNFK